MIFSAGKLGCFHGGSKLQKCFLWSGSSWSFRALTQILVQCHFCCILCCYHRWCTDSEGRKIVLTSQWEEDQIICGHLTHQIWRKKEDKQVDGHTLHHPKMPSTMSMQERHRKKRQREMVQCRMNNKISRDTAYTVVLKKSDNRLNLQCHER